MNITGNGKITGKLNKVGRDKIKRQRMSGAKKLNAHIFN